MDGVYEHAPHNGSFMFTSESVGEGHPGEFEVSTLGMSGGGVVTVIHVSVITDDSEECAES